MTESFTHALHHSDDRRDDEQDAGEDDEDQGDAFVFMQGIDFVNQVCWDEAGDDTEDRAEQGQKLEDRCIEDDGAPGDGDGEDEDAVTDDGLADFSSGMKRRRMFIAIPWQASRKPRKTLKKAVMTAKMLRIRLKILTALPSNPLATMARAEMFWE